MLTLSRYGLGKHHTPTESYTRPRKDASCHISCKEIALSAHKEALYCYVQNEDMTTVMAKFSYVVLKIKLALEHFNAQLTSELNLYQTQMKSLLDKFLIRKKSTK